MIVVLDKFQKGSLLFPCNRFSGNAVVDHNGIQFKIKGVLIQKIIIYRHLESRSDHTTNRMNGAVAPSIILQFNQPFLGIRLLYLINPFLSKDFLLDNVDDKPVVRHGIVANATLLTDILFYKLQHGQIATIGNEIGIQIFLNLLFLFSQRNIIPLAFRDRIRGRELPTVNSSPNTKRILILVFIFSIFSLALSSP